jgi:hypothetical protein
VSQKFDAFFLAVVSFFVIWRKRVTMIWAILRVVRWLLLFRKSKEKSMIGIDNIKLMVNGVATLSTAISALVDKGVGLEDLPAVQEAAIALFAIKDCKFEELSAECADLDATEQTELSALFAEKFNITADSTELLIEKGIGIIFILLPILMPLVVKAQKPV